MLVSKISKKTLPHSIIKSQKETHQTPQERLETLRNQQTQLSKTIQDAANSTDFDAKIAAQSKLNEINQQINDLEIQIRGQEMK